MELFKSYGGGGEPDVDCRLSENNLLMDNENKNKLQPTKGFNLNSFFEQLHTTSLACHKGFLSELDGGKICCNVCSVDMDSVVDLPEHFQTKSHEDSIIMLIKSNLPTSLLKNMEFITFYDSNLYCNLCKCNVSWSSENPFKTIVDIIAHNESNDHLSKKTNNIKQPSNSLNKDESLEVLQNLAAADSLLEDSVHFIDYKVQPLYKCSLCKVVIDFEEDHSQLLFNFSLHLNSEGHKKCYNTHLVFKTFEKVHVFKDESKHKLSVSKDKIFCSCSSRSIYPSIESLFAHVNEKSEDDLDNASFTSELSHFILEEPSFCVKSGLTTSSVADFSERYNDQTESTMTCKTEALQLKGENNLVPSTASTLFTKPPPDLNKENSFIHNNVSTLFTKPPPKLNGDNNFYHNSVPLNNKYESSNSLMQEILMNLEPYEHYVERPPDVYSVLNRLENKDFFVSRVSKYLAKMSNQVMCDVCDTVICYSSDEKLLKDSIKHHFIGDKHKNFMEKLTFDEKDTIVQLTFENPTIQANKQYIKHSGKYLHCVLCQYSLVLCLDHEYLQRKLVAHCSSKSHIEEIGKPCNSVFDTRPSSSQSTAPLTTEDSTGNQPKPLPINRPGQEEKMKNKISNKEGFVGRASASVAGEDKKRPSSDIPTVDRKLLNNDPNAIKILNLLPEVQSQGLYSLLKSFGPLRHFYLSKDLKTGLCKGFCLAHYQTRPAAERALDALNGLPTKYGAGALTVKWAY